MGERGNGKILEATPSKFECARISALALMSSAQMQVVGLLSSAILLIALDQSSKAFVIRLFRGRQSICFGAVAIRHMLNRQAFRGLLQNPRILVPLLISETVLLVVAVLFTPIFGGALAPIAFGLALGGAASNALDQLFRQGVIDFIDLGCWPVFNLADIAIVLGVVTGVACI